MTPLGRKYQIVVYVGNNTYKMYKKDVFQDDL